jgi:hypothetical protein
MQQSSQLENRDASENVEKDRVGEISGNHPPSRGHQLFVHLLGHALLAKPVKARTDGPTGGLRGYLALAGHCPGQHCSSYSLRSKTLRSPGLIFQVQYGQHVQV